MIKGMTNREKILLGALAAIAVLLLWYKLLYEPVSNRITEIHAAYEEESTQYAAQLPLLKKKRDMEKKLETLRKDSSVQRVPMYDNSKALMASLNVVTEGSSECKMEFGEPDADENIVIHTVDLRCTIASYEQFRALVDRISHETFANQISDLMYDGAHGNPSARMKISFFEIKDKAAEKAK